MTTITEDEDDMGIGVLDVLNEITHTDRTFFSSMRFLDGQTRSQLTALHLRNTSAMLTVVNRYMAEPQRMVINMPLTNASWMEPVPVVPSAQQIAQATETHVRLTDTTCSICQEIVEEGTRIRACGHCFHAQCIDQWFQQNPRCPMCRHDVRDLRAPETTNNNEGSRVHTNQE